MCSCLRSIRSNVWQLDDTVVANDDVPDLVITVVSALVQKAASVVEFPVWGAFQAQFNITSGQVLGNETSVTT